MEKIEVRAVYSVDEFCDAFVIGRTKAYEEVKEGKLRTTKIGRRTVITGHDALAWLDLYRGRPSQTKRAA